MNSIIMTMNIISEHGIIPVGTKLAKVVLFTVNTHVSVFSPRCSPRISDFPVILSRILEHTSHSHCVIDLTISTNVHDAIWIAHPVLITSRDSDWDRSVYNHICESCTVVIQGASFITCDFKGSSIGFTTRSNTNIRIAWIKIINKSLNLMDTKRSWGILILT